MIRPVTVMLDERHFEALQQLGAKLHMDTEDVLRDALRVRHSLMVQRVPPPLDPYVDLPAVPSQERATIIGETTPFSSKEDYYKFQHERVFAFLRHDISRIDPSAANWIDVFEERLLVPGFRAQVNPDWTRIAMSLDRRLTHLGDNLERRGCRAGFAQLMRPYTDPRVMPWVTDCGFTICKFVEAYLFGQLPGQKLQRPDTAMSSMIQELWAEALQAVKFSQADS